MGEIFRYIRDTEILTINTDLDLNKDTMKLQSSKITSFMNQLTRNCLKALFLKTSSPLSLKFISKSISVENKKSILWTI